MEAITAVLMPAVQKINGYLPDYVRIVLLLGAGLFFFAFSAILSQNMFGRLNAEYLFEIGPFPSIPSSRRSSSSRER